MKTEQLTVTVEDVWSWGPCWDLGSIREFYAGRKRWTARQIIEHGRSFGTAPKDLLWTVLRPELIETSMLHELACRFVESVLDTVDRANFAFYDDLAGALAVKRRWITSDATDKELQHAHDKARFVVENLHKTRSKLAFMAYDVCYAMCGDARIAAISVCHMRQRDLDIVLELV